MSRLSVFILVLCVVSIISPCAAQVHPASSREQDLDHPKVMDADPFDVTTGVYYRKYNDLFVVDSIPIDFTRTQRNMDPLMRSFGVGGSTSYDMFIIGDVVKFSWVALVFADGSRARFSRISPGTGYADGVFEDNTDPSEFMGARISWVANGWAVKLRTGIEYRVQGCDATSRPGQCGVVEIKNLAGDRVTIRRDRMGNIERITSPHGHFIDIKNDAGGRILHAQDDSGKWVDYSYDERGCLTKSNNWRHEQQLFQYDAHFNMISVHEWGPEGKDGKGRYDFTVANRFDAANRFAFQTVNNGDKALVTYHADPQGKIRQTDVSDNYGLSRYFFDEIGFEMREEFSGHNIASWKFEYVREPGTREVRDAILACSTGPIHLPVTIALEIASMGDAHKAYFSKVCSRAQVRASKPHVQTQSRK